MNHFDESLRYRINATNGGPGVVLNKNFSGWERVIEDNIVSTEERGYTRDELELLDKCKEHASAFSRKVEAGNILAFVHPMYLHLSHMNRLNDVKRGEAEEYFINFMKMLKTEMPRDKAGKILIETVHHYAAATSLLLEEGYVDAVIFTMYDSGRFNDGKDGKPFYGRTLFFGGGYNKRCLTSAMEDMCDATANKKAWAVKEICLNPPYEGKTLKTDSVSIRDGKTVEMISMYDLGKYTGVEIMPRAPESGLATAAY